VIYFFDNTHPPKFAEIFTMLPPPSCIDGEAMKNYGVISLRKHFEPNTKDPVWIPQVAEKGWIVISGDDKILRNPVEREIRHRVKLTMVMMPKRYMNSEIYQSLELMIKAWHNIVFAGERSRPGDCYRVQDNGKVEPFTPKK
jgi:hypothetical protein